MATSSSQRFTTGVLSEDHMHCAGEGPSARMKQPADPARDGNGLCGVAPRSTMTRVSVKSHGLQSHTARNCLPRRLVVGEATRQEHQG